MPYWVSAYVTPIAKNGSIVEYQSVRTKPEPEQVLAAEKLYGAAAAFAESLAGVPFASTQVGNIKYKIAVKPGTALVVKGRIVLVRGNKKHIYISFFDGDKEVYRAKFIMQILQ